MPAFTLYGVHGATNVDRVGITLAEGNFSDFNFVVVDLTKGEQMSKEHKQRHPWGKVPVMEYPNGFTLYESHAICRYLATKYSIPLLPPQSDLEATALFDQAASVEISYFAGPAGKIIFETWVKPKAFGSTPDEAVVSEAARSLEAFFDVAEHLLRKNEYMAGKDFSLVDIFYIPAVRMLLVCGYGNLVTSRVAVSAWWDRCVNRPTIKAYFDAEDKSMFSSNPLSG